MARKFLSAIKTRLSHPNWTKLQVAFGPQGGYKADSNTWSADMIYLGSGRDSGEKDPTVQALGFGSQIYGARADLIILDDVVMNANAGLVVPIPTLPPFKTVINVDVSVLFKKFKATPPV